jgi:segregation and condensation protein B
MNEDKESEIAVSEESIAVPAEAAVDLGGVATILEALLLAAEGPLSLDALQKLVGVEFNLGRRELREALMLLAERYAASAAEVLETHSGWRIQVRAEHSIWVSRLWQEKPPKYSRAALETLALIVYRQPITRGEIEDVRGVAVSTNILRTLLERGWIRELGHKEVPGRPTLYGTTPQFLDDFALKSLDQLPALPDIKDLEALDAALARLSAQLPPVDDEGDEDRAAPAADAADGDADESAARSAAPPTLH